MGLLIFVAILAGAPAIYGWFFRPAPDAPHVFIEAPSAKEVIKIKKVFVPVKQVEVIDKAPASKKLSLPDSIKNDDNKQITVTGEVKPDRNKGDIQAVAVLDTSTGKSTMFMKQKYLPLFGFENEKEIGVRYGIAISLAGDIAPASAEIFGRWTFARVGAMHLAVYGEASQRQAQAMIEGSYRW